MADFASRHFLRRVASFTLLVLVGSCTPPPPPKPSAERPPPLRVCADPNNLPFSNKALAGFENQVVARVAQAMGTSVAYVWWAQRRGFIRNTLNAGLCDLIPGTIRTNGAVLTTNPYYRSSYVALVRREMDVPIRSLDDPRLRSLKIGVQIIGDDYANTPPAHALARRGIVNVHGYRVLGDYNVPSPGAAIVHAVADRDIDVAMVWGPTAGYFAAKEKVEMQMHRLEDSERGVASGPWVYDISMAVRKDDTSLHAALNRTLAELQPEIAAILRDFHIPAYE